MLLILRQVKIMFVMASILFINIVTLLGAYVYGTQEEPRRNRGRNGGPHAVFACAVAVHSMVTLVMC